MPDTDSPNDFGAPPRDPHDDRRNDRRNDRPEHPSAQQIFDESGAVFFEQAMRQTRMAMTLADPQQPDCPIIFCNRAFCELTGYSEAETLGRNCRFLQGPRTNPATVAKMRTAIADREVVLVELVNYRKSGEAFWNALHLGPIYDEDGRLLYIFGSQWDVTDVHAARDDERQARLMEREISHRMKNMFAVISAIVSMLGRRAGSDKALTEGINSRIRALGRAHEATLGRLLQAGPIDPTETIAEIVAPYAAGGRGALTLDGPPVVVDAATVSILALTLNELAINSVKHGALSREGGTISVSWRSTRNDTATPALSIVWTEQGGPPITRDPDLGEGAAIVSQMLEAASGTMTRDWDQNGLRATIMLPEPWTQERE